jgi:hypothetical protein
VHGYCVVAGEKHYIFTGETGLSQVTSAHKLMYEDFVRFEVIPETVRQFTGLCDATRWKDLTKEERGRWAFDGTIQGEWKGREIYEDDIAKWIDSDRNERIDTVSWRNGGMILCNNWYTVGAYLSNRLKVIGNLHDNKDLLTTK